MEEIKACMNDMIKKVIKKENNRKWREKNPEYDKEYGKTRGVKNRKWRESHPEKAAKKAAKKKENNRKWREKNPNYDSERYWKDPELSRKKHSERWWKDPELSRKKDREYRKAYILKYA